MLHNVFHKIQTVCSYRLCLKANVACSEGRWKTAKVKELRNRTIEVNGENTQQLLSCKWVFVTNHTPNMAATLWPDNHSMTVIFNSIHCRFLKFPMCQPAPKVVILFSKDYISKLLSNVDLHCRGGFVICESWNLIFIY